MQPVNKTKVIDGRPGAIFFRVALALLVTLMLVAWATGATAQQADANFLTYPKQRMAAPAFSLSGPNGESISLADQAGKVVLINFWATWCRPCVKEMPALEGLWKRYRDDGLEVITINVDKRGAKAVKKFIKRHAINLPMVLDPKGDTRRDYEVIAMPTSYLLGRDGRFIGKALGDRQWDGPVAHRLIESALAEQENNP